MLDINNFYKGKKIFITGHTGFKGSWLTKALLEMGAQITGYSNSIEETSLYNMTGMETKINSVLGDIRDLNNLKLEIKKFEPEIVIHMAAQALVRASYEDPVYTYETNVMGTVNLFEAIKNVTSIKSVLNVTTDKVYENKEWAIGYSENDIICGRDPYSNSKSCSELITFSYKKSYFNFEGSPAISTARSGNVIGGGDFSNNRIIPDCVKYASEAKNIVVRNPKSIRPYQHVLDCIYGYLLLMKEQYEDKSLEGCYNFGPEDDNIISTGELVDLFCNCWGNDQKSTSMLSEGPHEANFLKLNSLKSKTVLGWNPKWNIESAILKTVEWSKAYFLDKDTEKANKIMVNQIIEYFGIT